MNAWQQNQVTGKLPHTAYNKTCIIVIFLVQCSMLNMRIATLVVRNVFLLYDHTIVIVQHLQLTHHCNCTASPADTPPPLPTRGPVIQNITTAKMSFETHHFWAVYYTVWLVLVIILFFHGLCCKPFQCTSKSRKHIWRDSLIKRRNSI